MAIISIDGFETGTFTSAGPSDPHYNLIGGSPVGSTVVRAGTGSRSVSIPVGATLQRTYTTGSGAMGVAFAIDVAPTATGSIFEAVLARTNAFIRVRCNSSSQLFMDIVDNAVVLASTAVSSALTLDQWYWLDIKWDCTSTTWSCEFKINGGTALTASSGAPAAAAGSSMKLNNNSTGGTWLFDDWIIAGSASYPLGEHKVLGLTASSDGTHVNPGSFTNEAGQLLNGADTVAWDNVNQVPFVITKYWGQTTSGSGSYIEVNLANTPETADAIAARLTAGYFSSSTTANNGLIKISCDGFTNVSEPGAATANTPFDMSESSIRVVSEMWQFTPGTSSIWTPTNVNALQLRFGYSTDVAPIPRLTSVLAEVAYPVSSSGPQTVSVSGKTSAAAFGTVTIATGNVNVPVSGKTSAAAFGAVSAFSAQAVAVSGQTSAAAFGAVTPKATITIAVSGKTSAAAFGAVTAQPGAVNASVPGRGTAAAFGAVTAAPGNVNVPVTGRGSAASFGTVTASTSGGAQSVSVSGQASAAAFGTVTPLATITIAVAGKTSAAAFGAVTPQPGAVNTPVSGLASAGAFGTVTASSGGGPQSVTVAGKSSTAAFGAIQVNYLVNVPGRTSAAAFGAVAALPGALTAPVTGRGSVAAFGAVGTLVGPVTVTVAGKTSAATFGSVQSNQRTPIAGKTSAAAFGAITIIVGGTIIPVTGMGSAAAFGVPAPVGGEANLFNPAVLGGAPRH